MSEITVFDDLKVSVEARLAELALEVPDAINLAFGLRRANPYAASSRLKDILNSGLSEIVEVQRTIDSTDVEDVRCKSVRITDMVERLRVYNPLFKDKEIHGSRHRANFYTESEDGDFIAHGSPFANLPFEGILAGVEVIGVNKVAVEIPPLEQKTSIVTLVIDRPHFKTDEATPARAYVPIGGLSVTRLQ